MCVKEKIELSCYVTKTKVELDQSFRRFLLNYIDIVIIKNCKNIPRGGKKLASCFLEGHLPPHATQCHPIARACIDIMGR